MDVTMNGGAEHPLDASGCTNLAELVALAERAGQDGEDLVVVGLEIDGHRLSPIEMSGLEAHPLDDVRHVSIERRPARAVARSVLRQGAEYSDEIRGAIFAAVDHLRAERSDPGLGLVADVTDSLTVLVGISACAATVLPNAAKTLLGLQDELLPWLGELVAAQTAQDAVRLGELLELEIAPRIERWGHSMRGLSQPVEVERARPSVEAAG